MPGQLVSDDRHRVFHDFDDAAIGRMGYTKVTRPARLQTGFEESRGRGIMHLCQRVCSRVQREVFVRSLPTLLEMSGAAGGQMVACDSRVHCIDRSSGLSGGHEVRNLGLAVVPLSGDQERRKVEGS